MGQNWQGINDITLNGLYHAREEMGGIVVAVNGCFDVIHAGHVRLLNYAKSLGSHLVVGINSDDSIRLLKGSTRPINKQVHRAEVVGNIRAVDHVCVFKSTEASGFLEAASPHIWLKGAGYTMKNINPRELSVANSLGIHIAFYDSGEPISTTVIINKLANGC